MNSFVRVQGKLIKFIGYIFLTFVIWFISFITLLLLIKPSSSGYVLLVVFIFPFIITYLVVRAVKWNRKTNRENKIRAKQNKLRVLKAKRAYIAEQVLKDQKKLDDEIAKHRHVLTRKYHRALQKNDYGAILSDTRRESVLEFLFSIKFEPIAMSEKEVVEYVCNTLECSQTLKESDFDPSKIPLDGYEFEHWVAESLQQFGWDAKVTSKSGDQGVDIIAQKEGISIGIQCKLYSQAVGNKAVQEAIAGKHYYDLDIAAVLTNSSFTKSAKELASVAHVLLLSPYDIPHLKELYIENTS